MEQRLPAKVTEANFSWINVSPLSEKKPSCQLLPCSPELRNSSAHLIRRMRSGWRREFITGPEVTHPVCLRVCVCDGCTCRIKGNLVVALSWKPSSPARVQAASVKTWWDSVFGHRCWPAAFSFPMNMELQAHKSRSIFNKFGTSVLMGHNLIAVVPPEDDPISQTLLASYQEAKCEYLNLSVWLFWGVIISPQTAEGIPANATTNPQNIIKAFPPTLSTVFIR